jgi:hypothetical protein
VPAAAVIPAPIVYIKVAAVKKLVVGFRSCHCTSVQWLLSSSKSTNLLFGVYWMLTSYLLVTTLHGEVPDSLL